MCQNDLKIKKEFVCYYTIKQAPLKHEKLVISVLVFGK